MIIWVESRELCIFPLGWFSNESSPIRQEFHVIEITWEVTGQKSEKAPLYFKAIYTRESLNSISTPESISFLVFQTELHSLEIISSDTTEYRQVFLGKSYTARPASLM